ncbi:MULTISPECIES: hypothetical protein [Paenibacillus]|uniref:hypothetical protein n=1 Tax=Paenibacillus TaxID=44249 RepID=UPI0004F89448|nr:hypothetical protein [Paenibacillus odorifer]AIQ76127.1 hypothetical protein PODO_24310 [Paenibacillus odorifer]OME31905.1 hypothetical protein BSK58_28810 [Paenibacillus odorifer]OME45878.1 hypothetical protein BSK59_31110 [Paenibacillus odorifer]OME45907.1 hypothetical protein BSK61_29250 [Paenibacillus odorifer]
MSYLSKVNRSKILNINIFGFLLALFLILTFYNLDTIKTGYLNQARYEITDGTEYRYFYQPEVLDEVEINKILEKYRELSLPEDRNKADVADLPALDMIIQVYGWNWTGIRDVSAEQFYQDRADIIKSAQKEAGSSREGISNGNYAAASLSEPIRMGYAEGWKNVNSGMSQCVFIILVLISILLVPIFNEDETLGVDGLVKSTRFGKRKLSRIRIINAFQLSLLLYLAAVAIYITPIFFMYGLQGADLPIQSSPQFFLSMVAVNYFEQFLINLVIGYVAISLMTGITLFISVLVTQIYTGYALLLFTIAISYAIQMSEVFFLKHYVGNFLPMQIAKFNSYYTSFEPYGGISRIIAVPSITVAVLFILLLFLPRCINKMRFTS